MDLLNKRVKNMLEYFFIFIIFFIGIRKGGYYKEDSLVGVYLIFLLFIIYFVLNYREIKINGIVGTFFLLFSCIYFIPIILNNAATMSGAINIATRVYSMYLIYIIVFNSQNKEKYIKAIVVFTIICGLFALDEISYSSVLVECEHNVGMYNRYYENVLKNPVTAKVSIPSIIDPIFNKEDNNYYLTTPFEDKYVYIFNKDLYAVKPTALRNIKPVINKKKKSIKSGDGSLNNPYVVEVK